MIKKFFQKFFIFLVLFLTILFVKNGVYAASPNAFDNALVEAPFGYDYIYAQEFVLNQGYTRDNSIVIANYKDYSTYSQYTVLLVKPFSSNDSIDYIRYYGSLDFYNSNDVQIKCNSISLVVQVNKSNGAIIYTSNGPYEAGFSTYVVNVSSDYSICTLTNVSIFDRTKSNVLYELGSLVPSYDFDYSFIGISKEEVQLTISNLDDNYIFINCGVQPLTYNVGDIVVSVGGLSVSDKRKDDLYTFSVPAGNFVNYYITDHNFVVVSSGSIIDMSSGYFLYGYETKYGIDFNLLYNGVTYRDETLNFYYKYGEDGFYLLNNSVLYDRSSLDCIEKHNDLHCYTIIAKVEDSERNVLCTGMYTYYNNLYSVDFVYTSFYQEYGAFSAFGKSIGGHHKVGIVSINHMYLKGTDIDGSNIDFSSYYVRWSVDRSATIVGIKKEDNLVVSRSGVIDNFDVNGYAASKLDFHFDTSVYVPFIITIDIYNSNGDLVYTTYVSSDSIISSQVEINAGSVNNNPYDVESNPNYTGDSSIGGNWSNIQEWTIKDYTNLMSTDNFIWNFFKAILGNLPWWIAIPMTLLLFGVVIITLIRFARGA